MASIAENAIDLGRIPYEEAWALQLELAERRAAGAIPDTLLACEHDPVYTFGRNYKSPLPPLPFPAYKIERGGKGTYHGPGQLVLYPICKLEPKGILPFVRAQEAFAIGLLKSFGVEGETRAGETGVWIGRRKIGSIGIAVKRWVSFHGLAINVDPDLSHFAAIEPCGYSPEVMTSLAAELGRKIGVEEVKQKALEGLSPATLSPTSR